MKQNQPPSEPMLSPVPVICMQNVEQTKVSWLWYPYIPFGKLTILQGNPGEGKTYFAMQLAAACTTGKALPNMTPLEPFNVIYQTAEDGLGADVDMNRANEVRPVFRKLGDIAQRHACAIILIGHLNKTVGAQSTYRGLGSIDMTAAVRSLLFIGRVKNDPTTRVLTHEKSSLAPPGKSIAFSLGTEEGFSWIGEYAITAGELLSGEEHAQTKVEQAQSLILSMLKGSRTCRSSDIEKAAADQDIAPRTVRMAKQQLAGRIKMYREGTQWMVELKD